VQNSSVKPFDSPFGNTKGIFKKLSYLVFPRYVLRPLPFELKLTWLRIFSGKVRRRYRNSKDLLVNLGCGPEGKSGWINVDAIPYPDVNCLFDCRKSLPFQDNSVKGIFTEHFFEHLDYHDEVPYFLKECQRVLQPGGVMRISVPDGEAYMRAYCQEGWGDLQKMRYMDDQFDIGMGFKYNTKMELMNFSFRQWGQHKFTYDFETLAFILRKYGFSRVQKQKYGQSILEEFCIDQYGRSSESLYVEAVK